MLKAFIHIFRSYQLIFLILNQVTFYYSFEDKISSKAMSNQNHKKEKEFLIFILKSRGKPTWNVYKV